MRGRLRKCISSIALMVIGGTLVASEFRSPLIMERGPLRYVFEEWEEEDYGLKIWSACYEKCADKAFLSHGMSTHPLTALLFGKSDFTLAQIMPGSFVPKTSQFYNPFLSVIQMSPRVTYDEKGFTLGARFAYPICKNKGRIGLRASVPFRRIEMEREDHGDADTNQLKDVYTAEIVDVIDPNNTPGGDVLETVAYAIRLDFLEALYYTSERDSIMNYSPTPANPVQILANAGNLTGQLRYGAVIYSPEGTIPNVASGDNIGVHGDDSTLSNLPSDGSISDQKQYQFATGTDYKSLSVDLAATPADRLAAQQRAAQLWLTSAHIHTAAPSIPNKFTDKANNLFGLMESKYLAPFQENTFAWLEDRGFEFESETRSGIGDIDLDLFYEHLFSEKLIGEIFVGVRFPTGSSDDYCGSPYRPHLGNGEHWEVRFGGLLAWQPCSWMNIKLDGYYSFALEATERRPAAFSGAMVKNIGPCVDADVDWSYLVAHLDVNLFHPKTDAISSVFSYEFYYKTKDDIDFRCGTAESWLGKTFNTTTLVWEENLQTLDNAVAERNTEAIAHKIRWESSFRITKWFELFWNAAYTFAGQNVPRDTETGGGFVVTF